MRGTQVIHLAYESAGWIMISLRETPVTPRFQMSFQYLGPVMNSREVTT
jgi:hypothetical protein